MLGRHYLIYSSDQPYEEGPIIIPILQMGTENLGSHDQLSLILVP